LLLVGLPDAAAARVWHVSADAAGANNGDSWSDAFTDLQDALAVAQSGDEIWVVADTYRPDRGTGDRTMSFELVCGVGDEARAARLAQQRNHTQRRPRRQ
jgi:hypothetical protein